MIIPIIIGLFLGVPLIILSQRIRKYLLKFKKPPLDIGGDYVKVDYEYLPEIGCLNEYDSVFVPTNDPEKLAREIQFNGDSNFQYKYARFDYRQIIYCHILKIEIHHNAGYIHYPLALQIASFLGLEVDHNMDMKTVIDMIKNHIKYNPLPHHNDGFEAANEHFDENK